MAVERKTRLRGAQVLAKSIEASDLSGVGEVAGNVATVQGDGTIAYDTITGNTFKQTFTNSDLTSNKITITHNLAIDYPVVIVYNNSNNKIFPSEITYLTDNTIELDFTGTTPITGNHQVRVIGTLGTTGTFKQSFINTDLVSGVLTVTHSLNTQHVLLMLYDNLNNIVQADEFTATSTTVLIVDLTLFGTITGTWNIRVIG